MHSLASMQWTIYSLSAAHWIVFTTVVAMGFATRHNSSRREKLLLGHIVMVGVAVLLTLRIIYVIEWVVVPQLHRHFSPLVYAHLICCAVFSVALPFTCFYHGNKKSSRFPWRHRALGLLTWFSETAMVILGCIVAYRLRP